MIVQQSHRSQGRRQSGRELETLQQDRLQKYTLLIINELAIDQFPLLRVNTITDSQVQCAAARLQGDRNSDEGTHNSCKRTLISRLCSVLRSHPKMPDKGLHPQAFGAGQAPDTQTSSGGAWFSVSQPLGSGGQPAALGWARVCHPWCCPALPRGRTRQSLSIGSLCMKHQPAEHSQAGCRYFSLPQATTLPPDMGSVLLRARAGSSLRAAPAGRTQRMLRVP